MSEIVPKIVYTNAALWPAPGIYANIPYTQYATLQACNATMLKALAAMSPEEALYSVQNRTVTESIEEGITLHTFILEPERFSREYPLAQPCGAVLASGKRKGETCSNETAEWCGTAMGWRCGQHRDGNGIKGLSKNLHERLLAAHKEIWRVAGSTMRGIYNGTIATELTLIWIDPGTEMLCKCRLDMYDPEERTITDIKKSRSVRPDAFGGVVGTLFYHLQSAWYRRGARACFGPGIYKFDFIGVKINKREAVAAQVLILDEEADATGEKAAESALQVYAECKRADQ